MQRCWHLCDKGTKTKSNPEDLDLFKIDGKGNMRSVLWIAPGTTDTVRIVPKEILPLSDEFVLFSGYRRFVVILMLIITLTMVIVILSEKRMVLFL